MADLWLAIIVSSALCGYFGYLVAIRTRRSPVLWTVLGVALNVFGLALYSRKKVGR